MYCILALAIIGATSALDCGPETCAVVGPSLPLNCKGTVIKNGGFCGCFDVCAKQAGESCQARPVLDGHSTYGTCEPGLICVPHGEMVSLGYGRCHIPRTPRFLEVYLNPRTPCEQQRRARLMSMVVWVGQWVPVCDSQGNYVPHQCDNTGKCFCVDTHSGEILTAKTDCSGRREVTQVSSTPTKAHAARFLNTLMSHNTPCEKHRRARLMSMVVWVGQWVPVCDSQGNYVPHQCDNTGKCFCVETHSGKILTAKTLGALACNGRPDVTQEVVSTTTPTKAHAVRLLDINFPCDEERKARLTMAVRPGVWVPVCDSQGNYVPHQCNNIGQCFCVDTTWGTYLTIPSISNGSEDCSTHRR